MFPPEYPDTTFTTPFNCSKTASVHQKHPAANVASSRAFEILACSGLCAMGLMRLTPSMSGGLSEHFLSEPSHQEVSEDAKPPRNGPGFLRLNSIEYRLEMLLITITLLVVLFYWRLFIVKDLNLFVTVFWVVFPDLGA